MRFLSPFTESFQAAVAYYIASDKTIAARFITAVDEAQDKIIQFPKIGRLVGPYREFRLNGFPYNYCYHENLDGEIVAVVLHHHRQNDSRPY